MEEAKNWTSIEVISLLMYTSSVFAAEAIRIHTTSTNGAIPIHS
jgi:hypothetical protein